MNRLSNLSKWIFIGIIAYVPFHVFLATWIGSSFGALDQAKVAKDVVLLFGLLLEFGLAPRRNTKLLFESRIIKLIIAYAVLTVSLALVFNNNTVAELLAIDYNLRFLGGFVYGYLLSKRSAFNITTIIKVVVVGGVVVATLGILQVLLLPDSSLSSVGYSLENGTPAVFYVDDSTQMFERAYSTLKDPNSFGVYLLLPLFLLLYYYKDKKNITFTAYILGIVLFLVAVLLSASRSALVGLFLAFVVSIVMKRPSRKAVLKYAYSVLVFIVVLIGVLMVSSPAREAILHPSSTEVSSNQKRVETYKNVAAEVLKEPIGEGPGSAGPVSFKNEPYTPRIAENYYIQLAQEVGWLGLGLFVTIFCIVMKRLWSREDPVSKALFLSGVAIATAGIFVHIWVNEAVAIQWWLLSGLALGLSNATIKQKE